MHPPPTPVQPGSDDTLSWYYGGTPPPDAPSAAAGPAAPDAAPAAVWREHGDGWVLEIGGPWRRLVSEAGLPPPPPEAAGRRLAIDARALRDWDTRLAAALWQWGSAPGATREGWSTLPPGLRRVLDLAYAAPPAETAVREKPPQVQAIGRHALDRWHAARLSLRLVGEVLLAGARLLRGRSGMRGTDLLWQIEQTGPRTVPVLALVSLMVGLILAYMGGAMLARFGAKAFVAELMTVSVVREIAALLTGVILSGRVGAAFAAQLGSMRANDEIDALRTLGVDPVDNLVLPRVLALLLVAPLLTAMAALVGLGVGWAATAIVYDVASTDYLNRTLNALTPAHVGVGLLKGTVYGVLVALAGCRQGLHAGRSAQAVGDATTRAVVQGIVWIVCSASLLTIVFQRLDV